MVRAITEIMFDEDQKYAEMYGLSTDTKPTTGLVTGSFFMEVDTGKSYLFNEEGTSGSEWVEQGSGA